MNTQRSIYSFLLLLALILTVSCRKVQPDPPLAQGYDPPIPPTNSYLTGPITFRLSALEQKINEALDPVLVDENTMKGKKGENWHLRVERTSPVKLHYDRQKVTIAATLNVWIDNPLRIGKRKANPKALCALRVDFQTPLAVANDWRLALKSSFVNYQWIQKPSIRVLGVKIGITRIADMILEKRRTSIEEAIDKAVYTELRLDQQVQHIWRDIQKPLLLSARPDSVWLVPHPMTVTTGPISGDSQTITLPVRIGFRTDTHVGNRPSVTPDLHLPALQKVAHLPNETDLRVMGFVPYTDLNRVLKQNLAGHKLKFTKGTMTINEATVYGGGRDVVLKIGVSGIVNGTLYFRGKPNFDTLTNTMQVKRVDFDVNTENKLLATADWLLHEQLRDTLQAALTIPLDTQIARFPDKIEAAFMKGKTGEKTVLDISRFRFVLQKIAVRPNGIQALVKVESKVKLVVKQL